MKNTLSTRITSVALALSASLFAMGGHAADVTWDFQNTANLPSSQFIETSLTGGVNITLKAFKATSTASTWTTSSFTNQGTAGLGMLYSGEPTGAPDHAVDSITATDLVVIDAGVNNKIDWTSLMIGYGYDTYTGGTPGVTGQYTTGQADIKMWTGNTLNTATATIDSLGSGRLLGNVIAGTTTNIDPTAPIVGPARYLVIAGDINDAFKLKQLTGSFSTTTQTPEPASMALLGLGLIGLGYARRRRPA